MYSPNVRKCFDRESDSIEGKTDEQKHQDRKKRKVWERGHNIMEPVKVRDIGGDWSKKEAAQLTNTGQKPAICSSNHMNVHYYSALSPL